jgi:hypothetical protein
VIVIEGDGIGWHVTGQGTPLSVIDGASLLRDLDDVFLDGLGQRCPLLVLQYLELDEASDDCKRA